MGHWILLSFLSIPVALQYAVCSNHIILMNLMDYLQIMHLYQHMDIALPYNIKWLMDILKYSNIEQFFQHFYRFSINPIEPPKQLVINGV